MRFFLLALVIVLVFVFYFFSIQIPFWSLFHDDQSELEKLTLENGGLKAQVLSLSLKVSEFKGLKENDKFIAAKIYSTYPFNDQHIFTVNVGAKDGIKKSMPVMVSKNLLLGRVIKVFSNYSEVESIFSPNWQLPVKIGKQGIDGLLAGGPTPRVTMVVNDKDIIIGDDIYSASKDFPYGLKIGAVKNIETSENNFFKEALVDFSYKFNNLLEVLINLGL